MGHTQLPGDPVSLMDVCAAGQSQQGPLCTVLQGEHGTGGCVGSTRSPSTPLL